MTTVLRWAVVPLPRIRESRPRGAQRWAETLAEVKTSAPSPHHAAVVFYGSPATCHNYVTKLRRGCVPSIKNRDVPLPEAAGLRFWSRTLPEGGAEVLAQPEPNGL